MIINYPLGVVKRKAGESNMGVLSALFHFSEFFEAGFSLYRREERQVVTLFLRHRGIYFFLTKT